MLLLKPLNDISFLGLSTVRLPRVYEKVFRFLFLFVFLLVMKLIFRQNTFNRFIEDGALDLQVKVFLEGLDAVWNASFGAR